jgi:hypothetical protein
MEYFKEDYARVSHDSALEMAIISWNAKFITHAQYQKATNALLKLILEKHCTRALCDTTHMGVLPLESQRWTNEVLTPKYMESQLQIMAIVTSQDVFNKVAMNNIVRKANNTQLNTTFFATYQEALAWIKAQKVRPVLA